MHGAYKHKKIRLIRLDQPQTVDKVRGAAPDFSISKNRVNPYIYWLYCPFYGIINVSFLRR